MDSLKKCVTSGAILNKTAWTLGAGHKSTWGSSTFKEARFMRPLPYE